MKWRGNFAILSKHNSAVPFAVHRPTYASKLIVIRFRDYPHDEEHSRSLEAEVVTSAAVDDLARSSRAVIETDLELFCSSR